ncbi:MAG TPA: PDZ domain-containing protein [Polyangiaceae bacterium]|nr:PDZ domain-containing protein [Polyangiaceae bacterium]
MSAVYKPVFACGAVVAWFLAASPAVAQPPALPPLPGSEPPPQAGPQEAEAAATAAPLTPQQLYQHVRRGVVAILRNGNPAAVGTVLAGDGRILTALSGLSEREGADVRYADGTTVHAKLGQSSKSFDLALLVPEPNHWTEGLSASESDPASTGIHAMLPAHGAGLGPAIAALKGRTDAHARGGEPLSQMLAVDVKGPPLAGAPLIDAAGSVVAVLVRACRGLETTPPAGDVATAASDSTNKEAAGCQPVILGAPVAAIRSFLRQPPPAAAGVPADAQPSVAPASAPTPWLGVRVEPVSSGAVRGVRIAAVAPQSPAEQAGLKAGTDQIVAIDDQPITSAEALADRISRHAVGESAKLLVFGGGNFREIAVVLRRAPQ